MYSTYTEITALVKWLHTDQDVTSSLGSREFNDRYKLLTCKHVQMRIKHTGTAGAKGLTLWCIVGS